ncbi:MAG: nucleotidyltransferase family protein [Draconibacterium sp.]
MTQIISLNIEEIRKLFKNHKVEKAYVFGSVLTANFTNESDIDFLVRFEKNLPPLEKGELWWDLHDKLRGLFNREIDLVTESSLKNPYFILELDRTKELIYG